MDELEQPIPQGLKSTFSLHYESLPPTEWLNVVLLTAFGVTFPFYLHSRERSA